MFEKRTENDRKDIPEDLSEHIAKLDLGQLEPVFDVLANWVKNPQGDDERIKAFAIAKRYLIATDERFRDSLEFMLDFRSKRGRPTEPLYAAYLTERVAQHYLKSRDDYAELSLSPEGWVEGITSILDDEDGARWLFEGDLGLHEVQTNVPARYKGPQLVLALYSHRFREPINLLDVGTSVGAGTKGLLAGKIDHEVRVMIPTQGEIPTGGLVAQLIDRHVKLQGSEKQEQVAVNDVKESETSQLIAARARELAIGGLSTQEIFEQLSLDERYRALVEAHVSATRSATLVERETVTKYINNKLAEPIHFAQSIGVDIINARSETELNWTMSNFYPSELIEDRGGIITKFKDLASTEVPQLSFHQVDFTDREHVEEFLKDAPVRKFDVITFLTMLHQLTDEERTRALEHARELLSPDGIIIIQDFAKVNHDMPNGLEFFTYSWPPYSYRTMVINPSGHSPYPEELLWWSSGRCTEVIIAPSATFFISKEESESLMEAEEGLASS